jgi:hypothetical protein
MNILSIIHKDYKLQSYREQGMPMPNLSPKLDQHTDGSSIDTAIASPETIPPDPTDDNGGPPSRGASYPKSYLVPEPA